MLLTTWIISNIFDHHKSIIFFSFFCVHFCHSLLDEWTATTTGKLACDLNRRNIGKMFLLRLCDRMSVRTDCWNIFCHTFTPSSMVKGSRTIVHNCWCFNNPFWWLSILFESKSFWWENRKHANLSSVKQTFLVSFPITEQKSFNRHPTPSPGHIAKVSSKLILIASCRLRLDESKVLPSIHSTGKKVSFVWLLTTVSIHYRETFFLFFYSQPTRCLHESI